MALSAYVWVLSDAHVAHFPSNCNNSFTNTLSPHMLNENLECALLSLDIQHTPSNKVSKERYSFKVHEKKKPRVVTLSVSQNSDFVAVLNKALKKEDWEVTSNGSMFHARKIHENAPHITLSQSLANRLGFFSTKLNKDTSSNPTRAQPVYVHCNIIDPQYFGGDMRPVFAVLNTSYLRDQYSFDKPMYHDVTVNPVTQVMLSLTSRSGELVPLSKNFTVTALLHFRAKK